MRAPLLVALAACGAPTAKPPPPPRPVVPVARAHAISTQEWLVANLYEGALPRAVLVGDPPFAFRAEDREAAELAVEDAAGLQVVCVAEATAAAARVVVETGYVRVLVWVDRDALARTVTREVELAKGVRVRPGVRVLDSMPGLPTIITDGAVAVDASLPEDALDWTWTDVPIRPEAYWDGSGVHVPSGTRIFATPSKREEIARVIRDDTFLDVLAKVEDGRWLEVEVVDSPLVVRGFVETPTTTQSQGFGVVGPRSDALEIPAHACLYDRPDGMLVAIAESKLTTTPDSPSGWINASIEVLGVAVTVSARYDGTAFELCAQRR